MQIEMERSYCDNGADIDQEALVSGWFLPSFCVTNIAEVIRRFTSESIMGSIEMIGIRISFILLLAVFAVSLASTERFGNRQEHGRLGLCTAQGAANPNAHQHVESLYGRRVRRHERGLGASLSAHK